MPYETEKPISTYLRAFGRGNPQSFLRAGGQKSAIVLTLDHDQGEYKTQAHIKTPSPFFCVSASIHTVCSPGNLCENLDVRHLPFLQTGILNVVTTFAEAILDCLELARQLP